MVGYQLFKVILSKGPPLHYTLATLFDLLFDRNYQIDVISA